MSSRPWARVFLLRANRPKQARAAFYMLLAAALIAAPGVGCLAQDSLADEPLAVITDSAFNYPAYMEIPAELRAWFRNPDGSCVQCSEGLTGMHNNLPAWTFLLWDTEYGKAQHGGSYPGRVAAYAKLRGMRIFNVTGNTFSDTRPWMIWAAKTNRFCAIGAGGSHFQCLYGYIPDAPKPWLVNNNNSTSVIDEYTEEGFRRLHMASGPWIVVPDEPASAPPPRLIPWWK